jgi:uncharacterized protein YijF (DUF1287 family)
MLRGCSRARVQVLNVDLQELVHRDMKSSWSAYPKLWGLTRPDPNIDHRRVPNLAVFFVLLAYTITGRFRYEPPEVAKACITTR